MWANHFLSFFICRLRRDRCLLKIQHTNENRYIWTGYHCYSYYYLDATNIALLLEHHKGFLTEHTCCIMDHLASEHTKLLLPLLPVTGTSLCSSQHVQYCTGVLKHKFCTSRAKHGRWEAHCAFLQISTEDIHNSQYLKRQMAI